MVANVPRDLHVYADGDKLLKTARFAKQTICKKLKVGCTRPLVACLPTSHYKSSMLRNHPARIAGEQAPRVHTGAAEGD